MSHTPTPLLLPEKAYRWAIKHLLKENDTDLFPRPYELTIIKEMEDKLIATLVNLNIAQYEWNAARRFLVPKDNLSYRKATQLNPIDSIILAAIIYQYGPQIEKKRAKSETVFSYRFKPLANGTLYSNKSAWEDFWTACRDEIADYDEDDDSYSLRGDYQFVATCDISDFYNQIYLHTIENQISACGLPNQVKVQIAELIKSLNQSVSRGIPVGPHATHLLAEMSLIPTDAALAIKGIPYLRYVDDMVFFCKDVKEARIRLLQIAEILDEDQRLSLQQQKTHIYTAADFLEFTDEKLIEEAIYDVEREILDTISGYTGGNRYTRIKFSVIKSEHLRILSEENIKELLQKYLDNQNFERLRWLYRRLAQVGIPYAIEFSIKNFDRLIPALNDMCLYISSCADNYTQSKWPEVGSKIIELLDDDIVQENPFYQISLLNLFVYNKQLNHISKLIGKFKSQNEEFKRKVLLASINHDNAAWIYQLKEDQKNFSDWTRRAYFIATKSLPKDQKKFLHRDIKKTLKANDILSNLILDWAK